MENERLARVEESMKLMAPRVERIENKMDYVIQKLESRWGQIVGACVAVSFVTTALIEIFRK